MSCSSYIHRGAFALLALTTAALSGRAGEQVFTFADPSSPAKVVIQMGLGDVHVTGADIGDVRVVSEEDLKADGDSQDRPDGLRRLDSGGSHAVTREGNVVTIVSNSLFGRHGRGSSDISVTVPVSAHVVIERSGPGETQLEKLSGDVEIHAAIGDIVLENISGGAVVETVNGDVRAVFTGLAADRPVSISAVRGDVDVFVPASSKADVRFRTLHGEVLTDFGDELKTTMEDGWIEDGAGTVEEELERAAEAQVAAREAEQQAREEARRAQAEAKRNARKNQNGHVTMPSIPPIPPMPPMHIPPMAGGRVVSGALNDGGTDISVTTLNGDIRFRKGE